MNKELMPQKDQQIMWRPAPMDTSTSTVPASVVQ